MSGWACRIGLGLKPHYNMTHMHSVVLIFPMHMQLKMVSLSRRRWDVAVAVGLELGHVERLQLQAEGALA